MRRLRAIFSPRDMTVGSPWKRILEFAFPMLVGNIAQQLYASTDSAVVGRYVGDHALGSVGSAGPILMFMIALFVGISNGAGILVSQAFGARDREKLSVAIGNCITLTAIASLSATGYHQSIASATISATADLITVGYTQHAGSANLSAIANLSATSYAAHSGSADLSAIADMVAVGESPSIIPEGSATLSAVADMTAVGYASHAGEAVLDAVADIAAVGHRESVGYAALEAVARQVATGRRCCRR